MKNIKEYEDAFFNSLLDGNRLKCMKVMKEFRAQDLSIIILYEEIFKKSLYRIGEMWACNKINVSVEHMSTNIIEGLMNELLPEIMSYERINKRIVISSVENDQHEIGGKMVADIFEKNCWDTHFLGANVPIIDLVEFCKVVKPDVICLSLTIYKSVVVLIREITELREITNIPIIIGGQALRRVGFKLSRKFKDVFYLVDLEAIENYIKDYH